MFTYSHNTLIFKSTKFSGILIHVFIASDHISSYMTWIFIIIIRIDKLIYETQKL